MARRPEIGAVQLYPDRPLNRKDKNGYLLKFYCPLAGKRIRRNCGTRDRREARRVQRECRERLLNGQYVSSGGAITAGQEQRLPAPQPRPDADERTWETAMESYRSQHRRRVRRKANRDSDSRLDIARRIFEARRRAQGLPPGVTLRECMTLEALEYLQERLLDGAECKYDRRSPNTVNSMLAAILAFVRYCYDHQWIDRVPPLRKIEVDEVMRGRPITGEEFERMLQAVPKVVGEGPANGWRFALRILWETGFRIADLLDFSWDDIERIHPAWPRRPDQHPTLVIPSTQKNGRNEEIPLLPGLQALLDSVPKQQRTGFVVNLSPAEFEFRSQPKRWFKPRREDLSNLIRSYSNSAIARACGVSDVTVQAWLKRQGLVRAGKIDRYGSEVPAAVVEQLRAQAIRTKHQRLPKQGRLTRECVSRIIARIGKTAKVVVRPANKEAGRRTKYASAHDLRRSCAERLINAGVSAESLMVIMRHRDFATTRKFYGATRAAQSAATEVYQKLQAERPAGRRAHQSAKPAGHRASRSCAGS